ncbi:hypothetical protein EI42_04508 [Thermosporothrix hazakensis]|jgi:hypothetical protein|uniref:Uncharacterized protein n=2 Tax=Thermosporothrix TaxID=768650 RepID=A0A326U380_THEHA|nr:DUF6585 family protein [Thermosporothrix hazakensis]PZW24900.1 hypothetical protein EI42_04508 [Thermosporothrix hazakensis]BBH88228.1 hypothetical protein KTC_29790 [Thermosporothrix sp. COM3]GCE46413.1 hypothetical protein KTH_12820 [Thermosporothrix hazakensis]
MAQITATPNEETSIQQAASAFQLGEPIAEHQIKRAGIYIRIGLGILVTLLPPFWAYISMDDTLLVTLLFTLAFCSLLLTAFQLFSLPYAYDWRLYTFREGFLFTAPDKIEAFRWDAIESVKEQQEERHFLRLIPLGQSTSYLIRRHDGCTIHIPGLFTNFSTFRARLIETLKQRLLPEAIAAYEAGKEQQFGPLTLSQQGITCKGQDISWQHFKALTQRRDGSLKLETRGTTSVPPIAMSTVPNLAVLQALLTHIREQAA